MKDTDDFDLRGKNASIQTKFNFGQTVWWIHDGIHIMSGEIIGIKGSSRNWKGSKTCELQIRYEDPHSPIGSEFWINEDRLFESGNEIIQSLLNQLRKEKLDNL